MIEIELTFPLLFGLAAIEAETRPLLVFFFIARAGGRGDAGRSARGWGDPWSDPDGRANVIRESVGVETKPGWDRAGLGGLRLLRLDALGFGTWRLLVLLLEDVVGIAIDKILKRKMIIEKERKGLVSIECFDCKD
jgi:hypothetical protein